MGYLMDEALCAFLIVAIGSQLIAAVVDYGVVSGNLWSSVC